VASFAQGAKMLRVTPVHLKEREELEPLLVDNSDVIERGLKVITHQLMTDSGPLDILAVDFNGALVVIELKNCPVDEHLDQGLRYYDWCRQNISGISMAYSDKFQIDPNLPLRLMLIAPSFTDLVRRIAKYIDCKLHLVEYQAFEVGRRRGHDLHRN